MGDKIIVNLIYFVLFVFEIESYSQPGIKAVYTKAPPNIDGLVTAEEWQHASFVNEFYQREPNPGQPISKKTNFYVQYDENYLYFAVECFDSPDDVTAKEKAYDANLRYDDCIHIILDTFLDHRNAFWFQISPRGSKGDALISQNGTVFNKQWDGIWYGKASIQSMGWQAEIAIPFKTLNFKPGLTTWGLKIKRNIPKILEESYWPSANPDAYKFQVSDAGLLHGLEGINQGLGIEFSPYGLAGLNRDSTKSNNFTANAGFDMYYQITPGLKSAFTLNTDFAQTEVDNRQINLTRFSLHFPEKREFFLDGAGYFNFGIGGMRDNPYSNRLIPFFSRRMGLDKDGNPIPVKWGAKMTGQVGKWKMGCLNIMDERESGNKNFTVARIARDIGNQSSIGFIGTNGNSISDGSNHLYGFDLHWANSQFRGNKNIAVTLFGLKSKTTGKTGNDKAFGAEFAYPNDLLSVLTGFFQIEKNFQAGVGFVPRDNIRESYFKTVVGQRPKKWGLLRIESTVGLDYITDMDNLLLSREFYFSPFMFRFNSGEDISFSWYNYFERLEEEFNIFSDYIIPLQTYNFNRYFIKFNTAQKRNFWMTMNFSGGDFYTGKKNSVIIENGYKINVPLYLGLGYEYNDVNLDVGNFSTNIFRVNANILFSPEIVLYNFIQYDNQSNKVGWQSRFIWIIKPGNEILLVWNSISNNSLERLKIYESNTRLKINYNYRF